VTLDLLDY